MKAQRLNHGLKKASRIHILLTAANIGVNLASLQ